MSPNDPHAAPPAAPVPGPEGGPRPPGRRARWLGAVVAVLAVALLCAGAWWLVQRSKAPVAGPGFPAAGGPGGPARPAGGGAGPGGGRLLVTVGEATVRQMRLPVAIEALGTVTPVATVTLRPQVAGVLTEVLFTEGQMVRKGQVLAQIDARPYEQALMQAEGTLRRDEAQLENARITLERYRTLLSQDSIARQDVDTQAALVKQLEGTVMTDRAQERTARLNLGYTRVTAPAAGRIGLRSVDAGNYVTTGDTTGLATITQTTPIDVQFSIPQDRVADVQTAAAEAGTAGLPVVAKDRTRTTDLAQGRFSTLDNLVDTATGTVKAKARFANADGRLFPNQFVNVRMELREVEALVVPVTAVRTGANGDFVYVINDDRTVTLRKVRRGQSTVEWVAIAEGLKPGERVVTEGGDRLRDGARVQLQEPGGPGGAQGAPGRRGRASGASWPAGAERGGADGSDGAPHRRRHRPDAGEASPAASAPAAAAASAPASRS
ncbi:efflux RND transporter periplasmic adaptor subunit [Acidovorax sp. NCPPB 3859]|nr:MULTISPECIES: efflux RND transporter periplasmic adaptor subunit [unclassified Acidovorax]MDA8452550.1 efflux RND transporter periplasmic adaptor subunit [Acidovorax sp. GBBC 3297]MDA8461971.1 efflux RND transporter periplasmic adaptor subunit [Acidovorax sp. GBBC 3333]MDA8467004.1 efflux RND transporter periplasmic adaptor subunit [Acidovorax sp. GBBC 3332]MDA8472040.1 efflux RND transporter periplasmic adaptor subunit [Acidovorax sp. GBBC 3299]WCM77100.1 efflux RND transporter periplasmic